MEQKEQVYIELLKEQIQEQSKYITELRQFKHEFQAHLFVMQHYMKNKELDKMNKYLSSMLKLPLFEKKWTIDVGCDVINEILFYKVCSSKTPISLETAGLLPTDLSISEMDLCVLFSNLISNSVEACNKLQYTDGIVFLNIFSASNRLIITMQNPVEWEINLETFGQKTSKEDKEAHGYGLCNIKNVAEKYNGKVEFELSGGLVSVKVTLQNIVSATSVC